MQKGNVILPDYLPFSRDMVKGCLYQSLLQDVVNQESVRKCEGRCFAFCDCWTQKANDFSPKWFACVSHDRLPLRLSALGRQLEFR